MSQIAFARGTAGASAGTGNLGGISAGSQLATSGTVVFADSNGVTFGMSNSSQITANVAAVKSIVAGVATASGPTVSFANGSGVSFGVAGNTVTASIATSLTAVNLSAGATSQNLSAFVLSNSNNVSFGLNGSTITASATVASTQGSINLSAGATSNLASAFTFANSNGVSFGLNASTITASINADAIKTISAGTTNVTGPGVSFANSNGISFGITGSTITATVVPLAGGSSMSYYQNINGMFGMGTFTIPGATSGINLSFQRVSLPWNMSATLMELLGNLSVAASQSGSYTISAAVYTFTGSTANMASSTTAGAGWVAGSDSTNSVTYGGYSGTRWRPVVLGTWAFSPGDYYFAFMHSITASNNTTGFSFHGKSSAFIRDTGGNQNKSNYWGDGNYSVATTGFPATIQLSDIAQTGSVALRQLYFQLIGTF